MDRDELHAPDVAERQSADQGFSAGWGAHFLPSERYWVDCHVHVEETQEWALRQALEKYFLRLGAYRLDQVIGLDATPNTLETYAKVARADRRFSFLMWLRATQPDPDFVRRAHDAGALGVKLHNHAVICGQTDWKVWESRQWAEVFEVINQRKLPILWHVTQRLTASPYTGGGFQSYWKEGWPRGVKFTNRDLLDQFLRIVDRYPDILFIGAHQLHVGNRKLEELFGAHPNLATDTSCGCFVRFGDQMLPEDAQEAREFFRRWPDRLLFGTDCSLGVAESNEQVFQSFLCHLRYIRQIRLPNDVLQKVAWENATRVFKLAEGVDRVDANTRP